MYSFISIFPIRKIFSILMLAKFFIIGIIILTFLSCKGSSSELENEIIEEDLFSDGTYCANIRYHNSSSNYQTTYKLNVEVVNNKLIKIIWSNGGWLDDSHFTPPTINENGECSFVSDRGYNYKVSIIGDECSSTDEPTAFEGKDNYLTFEICAANLGLTEEQLSEFEKENNLSRKEIITKSQCNLMHDQVILMEKKRAYENRMSEGYIQQLSIHSTEDVIHCQVMIVLRKGIYYLLEIQGGKATSGLTSFDPSIESWQEILIFKDPNNAEVTLVQAKLISKDFDISTLKEQADNFCN